MCNPKVHFYPAINKQVIKCLNFRSIRGFPSTRTRVWWKENEKEFKPRNVADDSERMQSSMGKLACNSNSRYWNSVKQRRLKQPEESTRKATCASERSGLTPSPCTPQIRINQSSTKEENCICTASFTVVGVHTSRYWRGRSCLDVGFPAL
jgi:hypothetical protein